MTGLDLIAWVLQSIEKGMETYQSKERIEVLKKLEAALFAHRKTLELMSEELTSNDAAADKALAETLRHFPGK